MSAETSSKPNIFSAAKTRDGEGLEEIIRAEIEKDGVISLARFMELALYHPELGYYQKHTRQTGRSGDFYTSVSVGSLYGELLGYEFARLLEPLSGPVSLVEGGAHDGELARDLLRYLQQYRPELFERLSYVILEPSAKRRREQEARLEIFGGKIQWQRGWERGFEFRGICFSNELLDAMPLHPFRWSTSIRRWREWGVGVLKGEIAWVPLPPERRETGAAKLLPEVPPELAEVLPDDFSIEVCPYALNWWASAACALQEGYLWTADYGFTQEEFLRPERQEGTLRGYSRHRASRSVLEAPGSQDITAHINFTHLITTGERCGLSTQGFLQQGAYLKTILEKIQRSPADFPLWTPMRYRQLTSLMHPEHLGRAFRILVQARRHEARLCG